MGSAVGGGWSERYGLEIEIGLRVVEGQQTDLTSDRPRSRERLSSVPPDGVCVCRPVS